MRRELAMQSIGATLNVWKRIDYRGVRNERPNNRLSIVASNGRISELILKLENQRLFVLDGCVRCIREIEAALV